MLMVLFQLGAERYAVDSHCVVEIVPMVDFKPVPHAPDYVAGLFNYRETVVPVIDLCHLTQKRPCLKHLSSRIILVDYGRLTGMADGIAGGTGDGGPRKAGNERVAAVADRRRSISWRDILLQRRVEPVPGAGRAAA
jgi:hypothetical protein